ncbi:MAG: BsaA family SipW-dependent biofilm matrix protein [Lachnospiraceae bacterium]|nr:BsaA family SipW-dependent biofilm matrix protein [Lachnospiraceae bacterium]
MRNKKKIAFGAAALAVVMVAAGTYAWFSTTDKTKTNVFGMDNFDVTITEAFDTPEVPLVPGADITKEVGVTNSGNVPVVVRVKLEETLELLEQETGEGKDKLKVEYTDEKTPKDNQVPVLISQEMIEAYKTKYSKEMRGPEGITVLQKMTKNDGENKKGNTVYSYLAYVTKESSVGSGNHHLVQVTPVIGNGSLEAPERFDVQYAYNIKKNDDSNGTYKVTATHGKLSEDTNLTNYYGSDFHQNAVVLNFAENVSTNGTVDNINTKWVLMNDGYFYYTKALNGTSISEPLLKSVSIKKEAGNTLKGVTYTITPVMEAVQMNWDAAKNTWKELNSSQIGGTATGNVTAADQLVYNIIHFEDHLGYHAQ